MLKKKSLTQLLNLCCDAGEGLFVGGVAGFVAAENLGDVAECLDTVDDGTFVESVRFEVTARAASVSFDIEKANGPLAFLVAEVRRASGTKRERKRFQSRSPAGPQMTS